MTTVAGYRNYKFCQSLMTTNRFGLRGGYATLLRKRFVEMSPSRFRGLGFLKVYDFYSAPNAP